MIFFTAHTAITAIRVNTAKIANTANAAKIIITAKKIQDIQFK